MSLSLSRVSVAPDLDVPLRLTRRASTKRVSRTRKVAVAKVVRKTETSNLLIVVAAVAVAIAILGAFNLSNLTEPANGMKMEISQKSSSPITLDSPSIVRKLGFLTVSGNAVNQSQINLSHIEAVVELFDSKHRLLTTESSLIGSDSFFAGQTVPFQIELSDAPRAVSYRIRFRQMGGSGSRRSGR